MKPVASNGKSLAITVLRSASWQEARGEKRDERQDILSK